MRVQSRFKEKRAMCACSLLKEWFQAGIGCGVAKRILKQAFIRLGCVFKVCRTCVCAPYAYSKRLGGVILVMGNDVRGGDIASDVSKLGGVTLAWKVTGK